MAHCHTLTIDYKEFVGVFAVVQFGTATFNCYVYKTHDHFWDENL